MTALVTIFLITVAIMFSSGGKGSPATAFFGRNLYLVKGNSFDLIRAPSIVTGEKIDPAALGTGDIVIFKTEEKRKLIGRILEVTETISGEPTDEEVGETAARTFLISGETGENYSVSEHAVISKAVRTSRFFGIIVNFASSPAGLLIIAVIPCAGIILAEVLKPILKKIRYRKEVSTVKKQDEVPTFIPQADEINPEKSGKSAAALKAYKQTLKITNTGEIAEMPELFTAPPEKPRIPEKKKPLSSAKLAEAIAAVNLQQGTLRNEEPLQELTAAEKARRISQAMADTKINKGE